MAYSPVDGTVVKAFVKDGTYYSESLVMVLMNICTSLTLLLLMNHKGISLK